MTRQSLSVSTSGELFKSLFRDLGWVTQLHAKYSGDTAARQAPPMYLALKADNQQPKSALFPNYGDCPIKLYAIRWATQQIVVLVMSNQQTRTTARLREMILIGASLKSGEHPMPPSLRLVTS
ncbi:MAG: hypothetical protein HKN28_10195 [Alphaproteobacteria bacterium]|nr:hypothetical protein [Alphaproteobacteria bacterium]